MQYRKWKEHSVPKVEWVMEILCKVYYEVFACITHVDVKVANMRAWYESMWEWGIYKDGFSEIVVQQEELMDMLLGVTLKKDVGDSFVWWKN